MTKLGLRQNQMYTHDRFHSSNRGRCVYESDCKETLFTPNRIPLPTHTATTASWSTITQMTLTNVVAPLLGIRRDKGGSKTNYGGTAEDGNRGGGVRNGRHEVGIRTHHHLGGSATRALGGDHTSGHRGTRGHRGASCEAGLRGSDRRRHCGSHYLRFFTHKEDRRDWKSYLFLLVWRLTSDAMCRRKHPKHPRGPIREMQSLRDMISRFRFSFFTSK